MSSALTVQAYIMVSNHTIRLARLLATAETRARGCNCTRYQEETVTKTFVWPANCRPLGGCRAVCKAGWVQESAA